MEACFHHRIKKKYIYNYNNFFLQLQVYISQSHSCKLIIASFSILFLRIEYSGFLSYILRKKRILRNCEI